MIAEIVAIASIGSAIGVFNTVVLFISTSILGLMIIRWQGAAAALQVGRKMSQGIIPKQEIAQSLLVIVGGILLAIPGFISDFLGVVVLLVGLCRVGITQLHSKRTSHPLHHHNHTADHRNAGNFKEPFSENSKGKAPGTTIDGEYVREDD